LQARLCACSFVPLSPHYNQPWNRVVWFHRVEQNIEFEAYDPNIPPTRSNSPLTGVGQAFTFAPNCYLGGGVLSVIEIFVAVSTEPEQRDIGLRRGCQKPMPKKHRTAKIDTQDVTDIVWAA